jgi:CRISPR/Cas system endoribonuclease Cas6 (RAMP superfamily)
MQVERWHDSQIPRELRLNFLNATTFRIDKRSYPLPEPHLVFGSLINHWQAFTNCRLRDLPDDAVMAFASHHIEIVDFAITSQAYGYKGDVEIGFRGAVQYRFVRKSAYLQEKFPKFEKEIRKDYDWHVRC